MREGKINRSWLQSSKTGGVVVVRRASCESIGEGQLTYAGGIVEQLQEIKYLWNTH